MGCLPYGHRARFAGGPPALRSEMRSAKRPSAFAKRLRRDKMKTQKLNQIKPFLNHRWTRIGSEPIWCSALQRRGSGLIRPNPTMKLKKSMDLLFNPVVGSRWPGQLAGGAPALRPRHGRPSGFVRLGWTIKFLKKKFNHGLRAAVANTDEHGWGRSSGKGREGLKGQEGHKRPESSKSQ